MSSALSELEPVIVPVPHPPAIVVEDVSGDFSRAIERAAASRATARSRCSRAAL